MEGSGTKLQFLEVAAGGDTIVLQKPQGARTTRGGRCLVKISLVNAHRSPSAHPLSGHHSPHFPQELTFHDVFLLSMCNSYLFNSGNLLP